MPESVGRPQNDVAFCSGTNHARTMKSRVDIMTIIGLGMLLMPVLTVWHEIGGHAAFCAAQGGHVRTIGAFYVECEGLSGSPRVLVSCAGVLLNILLAVAAYLAWRRTVTDFVRLTLWLVWVSEAFVAAGYFCFSGVTGFGDLAPGAGDGIGPVPMPMLWRAGELVVGAVTYVLIVRGANRTLAGMIGNGPTTRTARRTIAHGYYATAGLAAVLAGLLNPVGPVITIMSAAASSFGGLAGFISLGFATGQGEERRFLIGRSWAVFMTGAAVLVAFATILGPSLTF
jgi:hypothetical protein